MAARTRSEIASVEAPSGLAGFTLLIRLPSSLPQCEQHAPGRWIVRVPVVDSAAVRSLLGRVQRWLCQEQLAETRVKVGSDVYRIDADHIDLQEPIN